MFGLNNDLFFFLIDFFGFKVIVINYNKEVLFCFKKLYNWLKIRGVNVISIVKCMKYVSEGKIFEGDISFDFYFVVFFLE